MNRNLVKTVLESGGAIVPLIIDPKDSKGLGLMNPSILVEQTKILLNLRNINYTLYHCEGSQLLNGRWGPLSYLHPENDMHLRTWNYMCELNPDSLEIQNYWLTDTSTFDKEPLWDFVGLEDARLVRWESKLFQCGVRRDTTPNGQGRMELSEIQEVESSDKKYKEISRSRIEPPINKDSYCEKNWMPVLDLPYHFVKWTNPTEVVKVNPITGTSQQVFLGNSHIPGVRDFRGGSQVITWKDYRLCLLHEVNLFSNKLQQKDARYMHRFLVWDKDWNVAKLSEPFSFMDGEIEFGCGLALYRKDLLCTFGFQDNAAYLLRIPEKLIEELLGFKKDESDKKKLVPKESLDLDNKKQFQWGDLLSKNEQVLNGIKSEIFDRRIYEKFFNVEENDIVVDIGASVGPFTYSIIGKNPKKVYCLEPSEELFKTLKDNTKHFKFVTNLNLGIGSENSSEYVFDGLYGEGYANIPGNPTPAKSIKFSSFIENNKIDKINFLKVDCEGGEYDIFNEENFEWITKNVKKIAIEFHFHNKRHQESFIKFRDTYLRYFDNFKVYNLIDEDINSILWDDDFVERHITAGAIMVYIDNQNRFKWGRLNENIELKNSIIDEIFTRDVYQKLFKVEENDIVVDIGASVGPFTYSILTRKPQKVFCLEPRKEYYDALIINTKKDNIICINKGIGNIDGIDTFDKMWGNDKPANSITFKSFLRENNIEKIDFLKLDCEGGEYDIFTEENFEWIKNNVRKITGEFHLNTPELREKFIYFRDNFLNKFKNFQVDSMSGESVQHIIFDNNAIESHYDFMVYINNQIKKWELCKWPTLEITTSIPLKGCVTDCVFCPQRVLTNKYNGETHLTLENFKKALETVSKEITIIFSGFTEPFLNKETVDMILYAHEQGYKLAIFTTGIGLSIEDFDKIKHIPFSIGPEDPKISYKGIPMNNGGFTLHLPDNENYAKHPITNKYIKLIEHIGASFNEVQGIRIVCMGTVHDKVKHVFPGANPIDIWARSNNLIKEIDLKPELKALEGKGLWKSAYRGEGLTTCGLDENVYHNVVLPNGEVVICCQDYDQEHIIGNLLTQKYEDIIPEYNTPFNLCRFCENGVNL